MKDISQVTALVVDHGLGLPIAHCLSKSCKRVLYHTPCEDGFLRLNKCIIGDGFDNIERCFDPWQVKNEVDLWVFPDIYHSGWQLELEAQGRAVWGPRKADSLEMQREKFMNLLGDLGLKQAPYERVMGLTNLRLFLKDKENKFIKISKYRGSFETCHWRSWDEDEGNLDSWAVEFGPAKELVAFLVFDPLGDDLEIGGDTYTVDGQWPSLMLRGDEFKDKSYMGAVTPRAGMPEPIKEVLDAFSGVLEEYRCRSQWSMELRKGDDDDWYFTDPTPRLGLPSTASQIAVWKNFAEIIYAGAHGELVEPEPAGKITVECALTLDGEKGAWRKMDITDLTHEAMKLGCCCEINGMICFPPDECHEDHVGWLVAVGDTIEEAIATIQGYEKDLPDGVKAKTETLTDLLKEIHSAEEEGVEFSSQIVPGPEIVLEDA